MAVNAVPVRSDAVVGGALADVRGFFVRLPPFDQLSDDDLNRVVDAAQFSQFAAGETILRRWHTPSALYVIASGIVDEVDSVGRVATHTAGDSFDPKALLQGRSENSFVARGRVGCYQIPAQLFLALTRGNARLREYYHQDLSRHLDTLIAAQQQREAASFLMTRLGEGRLHPPIFVGPETTIRAAEELMRAHDTTAVLVRRGEDIGIFTDRDVRERSTLMGLPDTTPIGDLASYALRKLDHDDFLFNALVVMTKHSIRHIVVTRGDEVVGVFEQADMLRHLSNSSYVIASTLERAASDEELAEASDAVPGLIRSLFERGVKPRYIARLVTDLNRKLFRRVYERLMPASWQADSCLIVMGSEGRGEQLLRTDQDNGIIYREEPDQRTRDDFGRTFSRVLAGLGYPPCEGNVMVSNPDWAKPLAAYKRALRQWILEPGGDAFLQLAILIDASAVAGDGTLLGDLKNDLFELVHSQEAFCGHFAKPILAFETPIGWFGRIAVPRSGPHAGAVDIKKGGIFPIVHGVRSLALEHRLLETNTISRVQALTGRGPFGDEFTADLIEAFDFMSMLRLRQQFNALDRGETYDNFIHVHSLSNFERNLLRDSLKLVQEFKSYISNHYRLRMLT